MRQLGKGIDSFEMFVVWVLALSSEVTNAVVPVVLNLVSSL